MYFQHTYWDLKKRIALQVGHSTAIQMSHYSALVEVAALALGGGKDDKPAIQEDLTQLDGQAYASKVMGMLSI